MFQKKGFFLVLESNNRQNRQVIKRGYNMERITTNIDEIRVPGVVAEVSRAEAIQQGIFEEDAVSLLEAMGANIDLVGEVEDGNDR